MYIIFPPQELEAVASISNRKDLSELSTMFTFAIGRMKTKVTKINGCLSCVTYSIHLLDKVLRCRLTLTANRFICIYAVHFSRNEGMQW